MSSRNTSGFTLLELTVALTLAAFAIVLAHAVFLSVTKAVVQIDETLAASSRQSNGRRLVAELIGSLQVRDSEVEEFTGGPHRLAFATWSVDRQGDPVFRRVSLESRGGSIALNGLPGGLITPFEGANAMELDYLLDLGAKERWAPNWVSRGSAPTAIRVRLSVGGHIDTVLCVVGSRG